METLSSHRAFGGTQSFHRHASLATGTPMRLGVFTPPGDGPFPVLIFLAGLTCTEENFSIKAGAQRVAAELGLMLLMPDTSPRGEGVPDDAEAAFDFGLAAGFYLDATEEPWAANYRMASYVLRDLPDALAASFPAADLARQSISGHSMGGHGALTLALKNPGRFRSVSAFAPIAAPSRVPWGQKALGHYLGADRGAWRAHDAVALIEDGHRLPELLVDQGGEDPWLAQLLPGALATACTEAGIALDLRTRAGYDHSYYFVSTFIEEHLRWHRERLG